ncbi:sugar-binding transcriptional regulator [Microbacterium terrisoli]|jgi:DNA-binding transcriptional regulator LsrR (DeoR family)|uniref:sugar-binding transcriptional regulator n=1 Tax=Microbacterium terrisoli TaxID=3242192 RepID=UPI002804F8C2|nr:sugar-binding domain-containing protein [Microbacterium protaetiae]
MGENLPKKVRDALRAVHFYFVQDLTMDTIAREMHTSRSTVSRLLSYARETGLVEITIHSPLDTSSHVQQQIQDRYGITAHIIPLTDQTSDVDRLERVCMSAARLLNDFIDSGMTVGIAWGSTLTAVSRHLVPHRLHDVVFVQMNGAGNDHTTGIVYASEILRRFADAFGGVSQQFPVPAFFDEAATKSAMWKEHSTQRILNIQRRMDVAVFGIGSPAAVVPGHVYVGGYLTRADHASLSAEGAVGDVATIFYREDGTYRDIPINARATGPDFAMLRRVPRRIGIVAGLSRLSSLHGALAAGLITDLVIDEGTAHALIRGA